MNTQKLSIRFSIVKGRLNQKKLAPIRCRITFMKKRTAFSTGLFINPDHWDPKEQRILDQSDQGEFSNIETKFKHSESIRPLNFPLDTTVWLNIFPTT